MPPVEPDLHKQHFACFSCRKAFKQRGSEATGVEPERPFPCPECGVPMQLVGRDFQAPPQRAIKQWQALAVLRSFGVIFERGHLAPASPPKTFRDVEEFLVRQGFFAEVIRARLEKLRQQQAPPSPPIRATKPKPQRRPPRR